MTKFFSSILFTLLVTVVINTSCERISFKEYNPDPYDGTLKWERIIKNAAWSNRYDHQVTVFNNNLWLAGGYNPGQVKGDTYYEDVWTSVDGENWELVNENAPWYGRRGHELVTFNDGNGDAMYLIGGFSVNEETGYRQYNNDVWKSTDGVNWTEIKTNTVPPFDTVTDWYPRMHHSCIVTNQGGTNYIYLIGGKTIIDNHYSKYAPKYFNDVWRSTDGITWEKLPAEEIGIRSEFGACSDDNGNLYIQGGLTGVIFEGKDNATEPIPE